ncbi:MAG: biotin transporter BioY [Treponema sp.]|jgi:biotin transport system substrate-specific component|nr:biotin transporter BioY [Treponema sp.]
MENTRNSALNSKKRLLKICLIALFAALISAGGFISIPLGPVPMVLQNFMVLLAGMILGPFMGGAAEALHLLAGLLSLPVFAGGTGGIARFAGPTGGFLIGYLFMAVSAGAILGRPRAGKKNSLPFLIAAVAAGILALYIPGILWLRFGPTHLNWTKAVLAGAGAVPFPFVYLAGDIIKGIAAALIAPRLRALTADHLDG